MFPVGARVAFTHPKSGDRIAGIVQSNDGATITVADAAGQTHIIGLAFAALLGLAVEPGAEQQSHSE